MYWRVSRWKNFPSTYIIHERLVNCHFFAACCTFGCHVLVDGTDEISVDALQVPRSIDTIYLISFRPLFTPAVKESGRVILKKKGISEKQRANM